MSMAQKERGRKVYRTMQGKQVDIDLLIKRNELTPAVGNARVNARGDELGPGGKIVKKREEVIKDYYSGITPVEEEPVRKVKKAKAQPEVADITPAEEAMMDEFDDNGWVEDDEGNFVRKGG